MLEKITQCEYDHMNVITYIEKIQIMNSMLHYLFLFIMSMEDNINNKYNMEQLILENTSLPKQRKLPSPHRWYPKAAAFKSFWRELEGLEDKESIGSDWDEEMFCFPLEALWIFRILPRRMWMLSCWVFIWLRSTHFVRKQANGGIWN